MPVGTAPNRHTAELTVAALQLVASHRRLATLSSWGVKNYVSCEYAMARRVGKEGPWSDLYTATTRDHAQAPFAQNSIETAKSIYFTQLPGLVPLEA